MAKNKRTQSGPPKAGDRISEMLLKAEALFQNGDGAAGLALSDEILELSPNQPDALYLKGYAALGAGDAKTATDLFTQVTQLRPDSERTFLYLAIALLAVGEKEKAGKACATAIRLKPDFAEAHQTSGDIAFRAGDYECAAAAYAVALHFNDKLAIAHYRYGTALRQLGRSLEAIEQLELATKEDPKLWRAGLDLGSIFRTMGRQQAALAVYENTYETSPKQANLLHSLGDLSQELGQFEKAERYYREELMLTPNSAQCLYALSSIHAIGPGDQERTTIDTALKDTTSPNKDQIALHYGVANILHDDGDYDAAFEHFRTANELLKSELPSDAARDAREMDRQKRVFNQLYFQDRAGWGAPSEVPLFIIGTPRSGKSTVEAILTTDSSVHAAGERRQMARIAETIQQRLNSKHPFPECMHEISAADAVREGRAFLAELKYASADARYIVDTSPANISALGLIGLIVPDAKIIFCTRDPLETGLACYQKYFQLGNEFATDFERIGSRIRHYSTMMAHWKNVLPNPMLEVRFDELWGDRQGTVETLNEFLGTSAKAEDAPGQPISPRGPTADIDHYDAYLAPLRKALES